MKRRRLHLDNHNSSLKVPHKVQIGEARPAFRKRIGASHLVPQPIPIPENMERVYDPEADNYILAPRVVLPEIKRASPQPPKLKRGLKLNLKLGLNPKL